MRAMAQEAGNVDPKLCEFIRLGRLLYVDRHVRPRTTEPVSKDCGEHVLFAVGSLGLCEFPEIWGRSYQSCNRIVEDSRLLSHFGYDFCKISYDWRKDKTSEESLVAQSGWHG